MLIHFDRSMSWNKQSNICLDIRNPTSDYEVREKIVIDPSEFIEQDESSREPACHFQIGWEGSKKKSVLTVLAEEATIKSALKKSGGKKCKKGGDNRLPRAMEAEDSEKYVPMLALECRGIEPYAFHAMGGEFVVESEGGEIFKGEDVDLSDKDWADYDADNDISVTVSEFSSKFESI